MNKYQIDYEFDPTQLMRYRGRILVLRNTGWCIRRDLGTVGDEGWTYAFSSWAINRKMERKLKRVQNSDAWQEANI